VVQLPRWLWLPILHGFILRNRPKKSASKYAAIWTQDGSPLAVHTRRQAELLREFLSHKDVAVEYAMRYGEPAIATALDALCAEGATRILIVWIYSNTDSVFAASLYHAVGNVCMLLYAEYYDPRITGLVAASVADAQQERLGRCVHDRHLRDSAASTRRGPQA